MRVKLDEGLSKLVEEPLAAAGHAVATVREQGWGGLKDPQLWPNVLREGIYFITPDKGFGDIRRYPPGTHPGIMVLRPDHESILEYKLLLVRVLERHRIEELAGCITVVGSRHIRIRRPS